MGYELVGKLHKKYDKETKGEVFEVREFVILTDDGKYPQHIKFQLTQDRCNLLDQYKEGETINVHFDLRGREWQDNYFTNLNAWRLEYSGNKDETQSKFPEPKKLDRSKSYSPGATSVTNEGDLPF